jgi:hypothetical protein
MFKSFSHHFAIICSIIFPPVSHHVPVILPLFPHEFTNKNQATMTSAAAKAQQLPQPGDFRRRGEGSPSRVGKMMGKTIVSY